MDNSIKSRIDKVLEHNKLDSIIEYLPDAYSDVLNLQDGLSEIISAEKLSASLEKLERLVAKFNPRETWFYFIGPGEMTSRWHKVETLWVSDEQAAIYEKRRNESVGTDEDRPLVSESTWE